MTRVCLAIKRGLPIGVVLLTFASLGLPDGLLGVAWPSIRETFSLPLDALGALLTAFTVGFLLSSFNSGRLVSYLGVGVLLVISNLLMALGFLGYALAPFWWVMIAGGFVAGLGAGGTDPGMNTYIAVNHSPRIISWSHASFGLGATVGPMIMTAILSSGYSWQYGYGLAALLKIVLAVAFGLSVRSWATKEKTADDVSMPGRGATSVISTLKSGIVWLSIGMFLIYTGIELTAGQWAFTLLTEARGVLPGIAGMWVSIYWGSLTAGRLLISFVANRFQIVQLIRISLVFVFGGAVLFSLRGQGQLSFFGLALMGLALAPLFPFLIAATPQRVGQTHAPNAIGFQIGAAALGGAVVPGLTGVLASNLGLEVIGPVLIVSTLLLFGLHELTVFAATKKLG